MKKKSYFVEMIPLMFLVLVITGFIDEVTGAPLDSNPCVMDIPAAFEKIQNYGQRSGVWIKQWRPEWDHDPISLGTGDIIRAPKQSHMQGIQRLRGKPYIIVTGSSESGHNGHFFIGNLSSNSDGRFKSNLNSSSVPSKNDVVVHREDIAVIQDKRNVDGFVEGKLFTKNHDYHHASGLQVIGDYSVIALGHGKPQRVVFYDLSNPEMPKKLGYEILVDRADAVGIAKDESGYVLVVRQEADRLSFFTSRTTNLETANFQFTGHWMSSLLKEGPSDNKWRNYQNINLVSSCNGQLYLIGFARKKGGLSGKNPLKGDDWMDLYKVDNYETQPILIKIATKHIYCDKFCNFAAGGGIYVTDQGDLLLYGVRHFVPIDQEERQLHGLSAPDLFFPIDKAFIGLNEFRSFPPTIPLPLTNTSQAWVALYDDAYFEGPRVFLEGEEVETQQWSNYQKVWGNFDKKVSSVKWVLPQGYQYGLYQHADFKGKVLWLSGSGKEEEYARLRPLDFNDMPSSSKLMKVHVIDPRDGWVELFAEANFSGRRLTIWGTHTGYSDFKNVMVEGSHFDNTIEAVRFHLAKGQTFRMYRHPNYNNDPRYPTNKTHIDLVGTGEIEEIRELSNQRVGIEDKVSSAQFVTITTVTEPTEGWVELYSDDNFKGRRLTIKQTWDCRVKKINSHSTCTDKGISDYRNMKVDGKGFDNTVESIRFQLAPGQVYRLYRHPSFNTDPKFKKDRIYYDLTGTGKVIEIRTLSDVIKGLKDKVSSSKFIE